MFEGLNTAPTAERFIDCTGDVVTGDRIVFTEAVWGGSFRKPRFRGTRVIEADVVSDSYGAKKQQHTFTILVTASHGVDPIMPGTKTTRKGRIVYRNGVYRAPWADESARDLVADEKHGRGDHARAVRNRRRTMHSRTFPGRTAPATGAQPICQEQFEQVMIEGAA